MTNQNQQQINDGSHLIELSVLTTLTLDLYIDALSVKDGHDEANESQRRELRVRRMTKTLSLPSDIARCRARLLTLAITAITGLAVVVPSQAMPSMKRADFETVYANAIVSNKCFLDKEYLLSVWEAELLRARIRHEFKSSAQGFLQIIANCFEHSNRPGLYLYDVDVVWKWLDIEGAYPELHLSGSYGIGSEADVKRTLENSVNEAITEYLKANL